MGKVNDNQTEVMNTVTEKTKKVDEAIKKADKANTIKADLDKKVTDKVNEAKNEIKSDSDISTNKLDTRVTELEGKVDQLEKVSEDEQSQEVPSEPKKKRSWGIWE